MSNTRLKLTVQDYIRGQDEWLESSGLKPGDRVRVVQLPEDLTLTGTLDPEGNEFLSPGLGCDRVQVGQIYTLTNRYAPPLDRVMFSTPPAELRYPNILIPYWCLVKAEEDEDG